MSIKLLAYKYDHGSIQICIATGADPETVMYNNNMKQHEKSIFIHTVSLFMLQ